MKRMACAALLRVGATPSRAQTTFHGNLARTGVYPSAGPTRFGRVKWAFKTGSAIVTSPAIADGVVYIGSLDGHLHVVAQETGKEKWKFKSRMPIASSPAVAGGTLYFVSSTGALAALDVATGTPKWVFAAEYERKFESKNLHGYVYAVDAASGRKKWDYPTSKSWVIGTPAVREGLVYVGTSDSARFMALDARTGRLRFTFDAKAYVFSSAAVAGDLVCFGSHNGKLYAIDARTGTLAWEFQTEASKSDALKVLNPDGSLNQEAFAPVFGDFEDMYVDFYRFGSIGAVMSSPVVDSKVVYFGCMGGSLYAIQ
jgi:outer membrane protein assembly factor BamB